MREGRLFYLLLSVRLRVRGALGYTGHYRHGG